MPEGGLRITHPEPELLVTPDGGRCLRARWMSLPPGRWVGEHITAGKEEVLVIISGVAVLEADGERHLLRAPAAAFIPEGTAHNVGNAGEGQLLYVYVTGRLA
jgi:mannose-6-phosphate isomerase-like protein (cupin superfamily)